MNIHQIAAGFHLGDAISQEMLELRRLLQQDGFRGNIFAGSISPGSHKFASKLGKWKPDRNDIIVYHHSIHTEVLDEILPLPNVKILIYHNVTPEDYFSPYDLKFAYLLREGKNDLTKIQTQFDAFFGVSEYNVRELKDFGISNARLLPLHLNFSKWAKHQPTLEQKIFTKPKFLFVGRLAPNKKQDDLIRFARYWKSEYGSSFSLRMIGFCNPEQKSYLEELEFMIRHLELTDTVQITPYVDENLLIQIYKDSNLFLSMSEHEGFCVPLLEAMFFRLPVLAFAAAAVPETLNGSGILFESKNFEKIVSTVNTIFQDEGFRTQLILKQDIRLKTYLSSLTILPLLEAVSAGKKSKWPIS